VSFRREKFEPWGGPNGGDGGRGGDVILVGDVNTNNLVDYKFQPHWRAERGEHGLGSDCHGRDGKPVLLKLPLGTVVIDLETDKPVAEVIADGQQIVLCKGGNGGWGNTHFKTSTNRAPRRANPGQPGEQGTYRLVLKSIADVGLVGFPNAGKSSLTRQITKARPKTAAYPFTTLHPQIGVIEYPEDRKGQRRLLLADVPGLIEGAHENRGLGHRFLRHIERCALLIFLLDMAATDGRDPREDYKHLFNELELYDDKLLTKPRLVVANKMDRPEAAAQLAKFKKRFARVPVREISCLTGDGLEDLKKDLLKLVGKFRPLEKTSRATAA
jgi:GTP-binding protein